MKTIWVVEDDDSIQDMVVYALNTVGFKSKGFSTGTDMMQALAERTPDLILLDIMLPEQDGISILKKLKQTERYQSLPVIMLTAKGSEFDRITGLNLGADDYITKPFSIMEVIARINAVLRRCALEEEVLNPESLQVGQILLYPAQRTVQVEDAEITLTYTEFELLHYMMINEGIALSRDKLLEQIWGFDYDGASRTVDMHIKALRQKLGAAGDEIKTIRNVGYKLGG